MMFEVKYNELRDIRKLCVDLLASRGECSFSYPVDYQSMLKAVFDWVVLSNKFREEVKVFLPYVTVPILIGQFCSAILCAHALFYY